MSNVIDDLCIDNAFETTKNTVANKTEGVKGLCIEIEKLQNFRRARCFEIVENSQMQWGHVVK